MPEPTPNQTGRPNQLLTNIALQYANTMLQKGVYIAPEVFPVVPVDLASAKYKTFPREYFLRDEVATRPLGGIPRYVGYRMSEDSYSCEEEALGAKIDDRERANYVGPPSNSPEAAKVKLLQSQHLIHRDKRWAAKYMKTGVWTGAGVDQVGVAATPAANQFLQWDNANSDPIDTIDALMDRMGDLVGGAYRPNVLVLGNIAYRRLKNHAGILARLATTQLRQLNKTTLATILEVDKVLVPQGIQNTGPEKETIAATITAASYSRLVAPKDALLVYAASNPSSDEPSAGYTFAWRGLLGAQAFDPTAAVLRGRDAEASSDWFQVRVAYDFKVVAPELGIYLSAAVA